MCEAIFRHLDFPVDGVFRESKKCMGWEVVELPKTRSEIVGAHIKGERGRTEGGEVGFGTLTHLRKTQSHLLKGGAESRGNQSYWFSVLKTRDAVS